MCRMLGMVAGNENRQTAEIEQSGATESVAPLPSWQHLVGAPNALRMQAQTGNAPPNMTCGHDDSWGVGWFDDTAQQPAVIRQTGSAADSAYFVFAAEAAARSAAGIGPARVLLAHLRKASCGGVTSENAHPIQTEYTAASGARETLLVAHNGTVHPPLLQTLRHDLQADDRQEARADSDTVVLAGWLANEIGKRGPDALFDSLANALRDLYERATVAAVAQSGGGGDLTRAYSGMNLLIGHRDGLFALRQFSQWPEYYTLFVRRLNLPDDGEAGGWIVASEATDESADWEALAPHILTFFPVASEAVQTAVVAAPFIEAVMVK